AGFGLEGFIPGKYDTASRFAVTNETGIIRIRQIDLRIPWKAAVQAYKCALTIAILKHNRISGRARSLLCPNDRAAQVEIHKKRELAPVFQDCQGVFGYLDLVEHRAWII